MPNETTFVPILVDADQAARLLSISLRHFHSLRKEPGFPAPVSLGVRSTRWLRSELEGYFQGLPRKTEEEPPQLSAARAAKGAGQPVHPAPFGGVPA